MSDSSLQGSVKHVLLHRSLVTKSWIPVLRSAVRDSQIQLGGTPTAHGIHHVSSIFIYTDGLYLGLAIKGDLEDLAADFKNGQLQKWIIAKDNPPSVGHAAQTAIAVVVSFLIARSFHLPEAYWAPMATLIVMQSTLSAALPISVQYFAGTAVGAAAGAVADTYFQGSVWAFGAAVFIIGSLGVLLRVERGALRYAGITLAIVMLVPRSTSASAQLVALHRFFEVSIGLAVGLVLLAVWRKIGLGFLARANHEARSLT